MFDRINHHELLKGSDLLRKKQYRITNSDQIIEFLWISYFKGMQIAEEAKVINIQDLFYLEHKDINVPFPFKKPKL